MQNLHSSNFVLSGSWMKLTPKFANNLYTLPLPNNKECFVFSTCSFVYDSLFVKHVILLIKLLLKPEFYVGQCIVD